MYKYDIHVHTSETSRCAHMTAKETLSRYKDAGFSGVCITDHYSPGLLDDLPGTWYDKADKLLAGYRAAKEADIISVFLGTEINFGNAVGGVWEQPYCSNDYLVYGLTEDMFYDFPEFHHMDFKDFSAFAKENNLCVIQAHPFRNRMKMCNFELIDGIEVYNANPRHLARNNLSEEFARGSGYILTSGSDCHRDEDVARGGIATTQPIKSSSDLRDVLFSRSFELIKNG